MFLCVTLGAYREIRNLEGNKVKSSVIICWVENLNSGDVWCGHFQSHCVGVRMCGHAPNLYDCHRTVCTQTRWSSNTTPSSWPRQTRYTRSAALTTWPPGTSPLECCPSGVYLPALSCLLTRCTLDQNIFNLRHSRASISLSFILEASLHQKTLLLTRGVSECKQKILSLVVNFVHQLKKCSIITLISRKLHSGGYIINIYIYTSIHSYGSIKYFIVNRGSLWTVYCTRKTLIGTMILSSTRRVKVLSK